MACRSASEAEPDLALTCFDSPTVSTAIPVSDAIQAQFTRDQPVARERWLELGQRTGADFAVLFRPESVTASRGISVTGSRAARMGAAVGGLVGGLIMASGGPMFVRTRGYTLSAVLVDLRVAKEVRAAVRSRDASSDENTELPVSYLLHDIMKDLLVGLLDR